MRISLDDTCSLFEHLAINMWDWNQWRSWCLFDSFLSFHSPQMSVDENFSLKMCSLYCLLYNTRTTRIHIHRGFNFRIPNIPYNHICILKIYLVRNNTYHKSIELPNSLVLSTIITLDIVCERLTIVKIRTQADSKSEYGNMGICCVISVHISHKQELTPQLYICVCYFWSLVSNVWAVGESLITIWMLHNVLRVESKYGT